MIQNVASHLGQSPLFGVLSVCLFFSVFAGALIFAAVQKKPHLDRMSALPLDEPGPQKEESHE